MVLPFSKGLKQLRREEEEYGRVSPRNTGNMNYPEELLLCIIVPPLTVCVCHSTGSMGFLEPVSWLRLCGVRALYTLSRKRSIL